MMLGPPFNIGQAICARALGIKFLLGVSHSLPAEKIRRRAWGFSRAGVQCVPFAGRMKEIYRNRARGPNCKKVFYDASVPRAGLSSKPLRKPVAAIFPMSVWWRSEPVSRSAIAFRGFGGSAQGLRGGLLSLLAIVSKPCAWLEFPVLGARLGLYWFAGAVHIADYFSSR